ncbi:MAG: hypothetical protein J6A04_07090 [Clostridia bacterium]|nr:hypothetical protein [Clostridia bacterium]
MINCYNTKKITSSNQGNLKIGGLIGDSYDSTVENCYNSGELEIDFCSKKDGKVGGIVGHGSSDTIRNSYNLKAITVKNLVDGNYIGAIAGTGGGSTFERNYYLEGTATSGVGNEVADAEGILEAKSRADILNLMNTNLPSDVWEQGKNGEYPGLK